MLRSVLERFRRDEAPERLYAQIVAQARQPVFYARLGVPDTAEGRFDMIVLHAILVMRRLRGEGGAGRDLAQALFDALFRDMDANLREMGVSDVAVPKRVKGMARAFYGRAAAYDGAIDAADRPSLAVALRRNVYRNATDADADRLAGYVLASETRLGQVPYGEVAAGNLPWAEAEEGAE